MKNIDRKFKILAVNPVTGKIYTEEDAIILCAKDLAVPAALVAYRDKCVEIGANAGHVESIDLMVRRVCSFQANMEGGVGRVPDTVGAELANCLDKVKKYRPSNSTEADSFWGKFCYQCSKQFGAVNCRIPLDTQAFGINEPEYPKEWVYDSDDNPVCTAFDRKDGY